MSVEPEDIDQVIHLLSDVELQENGEQTVHCEASQIVFAMFYKHRSIIGARLNVVENFRTDIIDK